MAKEKKATIHVQGTAISIVSQKEDDYISLTDMANKFGGDDLIYNWMRNRNTVEFLGIWEQIHNPDFKGVEFDTFRKEAGLNSFRLTPKKWTEATNAIGIQSRAGKKGNLLDYSGIEQLLVLANLQSKNAEFIRMGLSQGERLRKLNTIAIQQLKSLVGNSKLKQLGDGN
jgi:hypothetical protein